MDFFAKFCLVTVKALAESWHVNSQFIEDLIGKHELPVVLVGDNREIRICVADAIAWVERNKTTHEDVRMPREKP